MHNQRCTTWYLLILLLVLAPLSHADKVTQNRVGTLSWESTRVPPTISLNEANRAAAKYLGLTATSDRSAFVQITDSTRYGNVAQTVFPGWQLHYTGIPVANKNTGASSLVNLTVLIDGSTGPDGRPTKALVAAITDINQATWLPPILPKRDYTQAMQDDGWQVDRLPSTPLNSNATQLFAALWANNGIDPAQAGQILLRPMQVTLALPAKRDSSGRLQPLQPSGIYWIALVTGTKTHIITPPDSIVPSPATTRDERYMTGLVALFSDIGQQSVRGVYLP
ncbi:hypothetical protein [Sulfuriflexus mobilis]|uniref:hypothetical protein n=1 Tax=Sulfuriflexus mobilis TaxID=1811807 RepID=UPI000F8207B5|nr:hypothetical protein [Sulfuriflexus mobilis]